MATPQWPSEGLTLRRPPVFCQGLPLATPSWEPRERMMQLMGGGRESTRGSEQGGEKWGVDLGATEGATHKAGSQPTPTPG